MRGEAHVTRIAYGIAELSRREGSALSISSQNARLKGDWICVRLSCAGQSKTALAQCGYVLQIGLSILTRRITPLGYLYTYIPIYLYTHIPISIYIQYLYTYIPICLYITRALAIAMPIHISMGLYTCVPTYLQTYIPIYLNTYVSIYIYIYYISIYLYTYTYLHRYRHRLKYLYRRGTGV